MQSYKDFIGLLGIPFPTNVGDAHYWDQIRLFKLVMCVVRVMGQLSRSFRFGFYPKHSSTLFFLFLCFALSDFLISQFESFKIYPISIIVVFVLFHP